MRSRVWKDLKLLRSVAALCLPAVCVVALGVYFLVDKVPGIEKAERARVRAVYREAVRDLRAAPGTVRMPAESIPKEWKRTSAKMSPGRWGWFVEPGSGTARVWYQEGDWAIAGDVPAERENDYRTMLAIFVLLFLLVLVATAVVGARCLVEYVRTRDDFLAAAAHDLSSPLVGMRYFIGADAAEARVLNERTLRLVANIKDFLILGARRAPPVVHDIDLLACFNEAYGLFREDFRELFDGADIPVAAGELPSRLARGDETLVVQILWNILGNELKYAAADGAVRAAIVCDGPFARVEIADEGKGMTPREMRHAFDRYYRAQSVLESGKSGFGIGLCAARELAGLMHGTLAVRANEPRGCVFTLTLPRAAPGGGAEGARA